MLCRLHSGLYYKIRTDGRTDLNFNFEPVSPVSHSDKFSGFLSEFIVLRVEIEERNLVLALLREIHGSAAWENYRFSRQLYARMHGLKYAFSKLFWGGAQPAPPQTSPPLNLGLSPRFELRSNSRALCALDPGASPSIHPLQNVY